MSPAHNQVPGQLERVAELESSSLSRIRAAAEDLQRIECLDEEQRAEIHAILEALRHEGESHTNAIKQLHGEYRNA